MVKGMSRKVVVIKSPDKKIFEEAIFIVKEDLFKRSGVSTAEVINEAQRVASEYVKENCGSKKFFSRFSQKAIFASGAAVTGILWLTCVLLGIC